MTILELALGIYSIGGASASIISVIDVALRRANSITAEDLFKKSLVDVVKQKFNKAGSFHCVWQS